MQSVIAQRIGGGTLYKLLLIGMVWLHLVTSLTVLVLVVVDVLPMEAGLPPGAEEPSMIITLGIAAAYMAIGVVTAPLWVGIMWLGIWPGLWIYSLLRPIVLRYRPRHLGD